MNLKRYFYIYYTKRTVKRNFTYPNQIKYIFSKAKCMLTVRKIDFKFKQYLMQLKTNLKFIYPEYILN